ncbi:hypothetical protein L1049_001891 [Liquidambar formosana]|uniref:Uncharacterized protein n=1 Tax=Liquidambar formosana TaxID=63359 RepID=A0AAP0R957_LIQFO
MEEVEKEEESESKMEVAVMEGVASIAPASLWVHFRPLHPTPPFYLLWPSWHWEMYVSDVKQCIFCAFVDIFIGKRFLWLT